MVGEGGSREKDLRLVGQEFHRWGEEFRTERSDNLSLNVRGGRERDTDCKWSEKRVLSVGLMLMWVRRQFGADLWRTLWTIDMILYCMLCSTWNRWSDVRVIIMLAYFCAAYTRMTMNESPPSCEQRRITFNDDGQRVQWARPELPAATLHLHVEAATNYTPITVRWRGSAGVMHEYLGVRMKARAFWIDWCLRWMTRRRE